jgi:aryl-alcohol dehydrogenase-like predicted oxidoreductase
MLRSSSVLSTTKKESSVKFTNLGSTGLEVSSLALGCMTFGEPGRGKHSWTLPEEESRAIIRAAVEEGINFFDTADSYSAGSSEEIVGRALSDFACRDSVVIATKVHRPMRPGPNGGGLSRKAIMAAIDASLRRLQVDYVDLYQIHRWDPKTPIEETLQALNDIVRAGKALYIGASSMYAWQFSKALYVARSHGWAEFVAMQNHYSLLNREEEREMLPLCADQGIATTPWSPLARGRLTRPWGKTTGRSQDDPRGSATYGEQPCDQVIVERVGEVASRRELPRAQIALAWVMSKPAVAAPIVGARTLGHLNDALAAVDIDLCDDEVNYLEEPYEPHRADAFA